MPRVTVCMAVYNGKETIEAALESVVAQTYQDFRIIVLDDGSSDDSISRVEKFDATTISVPNGGLGAARKRLVEEADGELIAFIDRDDLWLPEKLEREVAHLDFTGADLVHADGWYVYEGGGEVARNLAIDPATHAFEHILPNNRIIASSVLFKRDAMLAAGNFVSETPRCSDWYGWMMMARKFKFAHLAEKLVRYNVLSTSLANSGYRFHESQYKLITEHFLPRRAELFGALSPADRNRYRRTLVRDAGIALSAMARHKKRDGEPILARKLAIEAIKISPDVLRVWTRALSVCMSDTLQRRGGNLGSP